VPSREDNMPLTAMEAQSCGRAVVAFDLGGLPDIVDHEHSGYLAPPLDTGALGDGLRRALDDSRGAQAWQQKARERAVSTWSRTVVNRAYMQVFMEALSSHER
jgi:glycosyltransferase involved in cell wall biosynthesis